ncbi:MAG: 30S ribosomal protein S18 [Sedimentisphaerales bacterium]|nr:30S ribosomal protein S18 [Sedimentisphaerales bacterium]
MISRFSRRQTARDRRRGDLIQLKKLQAITEVIVARSKKVKVREALECRFCRDKIDYIDYKNVDRLQKLLTQRGKIFSRKRSGNCAGCQRKAQRAIKRARYMGLLPYTT